jgi:hypothetical protein
VGIKLLSKEWQGRNPPADPLAMVGKEKVKETIYNERTGSFVTQTSTPYIEELSWEVDFATECYHGGRNEQMWFGATWEDNWTDYDFSSAYPTAMALISKPEWSKIKAITDLSEITASHLACACVDFEFPKSVRYPTLPVRTPHGIVFPLSGRSYCFSPEIELARQLGCKMTVKKGVCVPIESKEKVFFPFIRDSIAQRQQATTDFQKAFWKEITNSCYGKTAQGLRDKRVFNLKKKASERIPPSQISNPIFAGYITSYVRALVGEVMNRLPQGRMIFSVTTDGFLTNASSTEIADAQQGNICLRFAAARRELTGNAGILEEKHNARKLVGWRTRGQATLKAGDGQKSEPIVLARAGIKPPLHLSETREHNDYIVDTFFERTNKSKIELDVHTSFREMIVYDADLVSKKTAKHISMEYDFKRRPFSVVEPNPDSPHREFRHVAFSTVPWNSVGEFMEVRKCHNDYFQKTRQCMKTADDYRDFAETYDSLKALGTHNAKYLKKKNASLKRLQRDLCRAFKEGAAGMNEIAVAMTARQFAELLNNCGLAKRGVKTVRSNVENGAKKAFSPNTTPTTKEVLEVLGKLKEAIPALDIGSILAVADNKWSLSQALTTSCLFTEQLMREALQ